MLIVPYKVGKALLKRGQKGGQQRKWDGLKEKGKYVETMNVSYQRH